MLPKKVVLAPIQSCRLFHKFEDMVEFTVVKILRSSLCNHNLETISHIFIDCPATSSFLQGVNLFIRSNIDANYDDPYRHYLICLNHSDKSVNFINSVCCWFIGRSFQNKEPLFWERYLKHLKLFLLGEKPDIIRCLKDVIP